MGKLLPITKEGCYEDACDGLMTLLQLLFAALKIMTSLCLQPRGTNEDSLAQPNHFLFELFFQNNPSQQGYNS